MANQVGVETQGRVVPSLSNEASLGSPKIQRTDPSRRCRGLNKRPWVIYKGMRMRESLPFPPKSSPLHPQHWRSGNRNDMQHVTMPPPPAVSLSPAPTSITPPCQVRDTPESRVSYARIPAVDVISQRFRGDPYW